MLVRGPNYIGRAVKTDPTSCSTLWRLLNKRNVASCWRISDRFQACETTPNNTQQHATGPGVQTDAIGNIQQCCVRLH